MSAKPASAVRKGALGKWTSWAEAFLGIAGNRFDIDGGPNGLLTSTVRRRIFLVMDLGVRRLFAKTVDAGRAVPRSQRHGIDARLQGTV